MKIKHQIRSLTGTIRLKAERIFSRKPAVQPAVNKPRHHIYDTARGKACYISLATLIVACYAAAQTQAKPKTQYHVSTLPSLGGTSSGGNSINDQSWVAGYSRMLDRDRHAILWRNSALADLGTLGGPNSSVTWNVKNTAGIIVGISQTSTPEPLGESWSSASFYSTPNNVGFINLGFVWQNSQMRALPNFPGGNNGFATGANNLGRVVGWAENGFHDPTCCCSPSQATRFSSFSQPCGTLVSRSDPRTPLIPGDTSGAATAINDNGQIVGISGICDQAVGRHTARHAVLWENGTVTDIYPDAPLRGGIRRRQSINTAISSGLPATPPMLDGNILHAFIWTKDNGIKVLKPLRGRTPQHIDSEAYGINEAGQVVGVSCAANQVDCRAVIWDHGVYPTDLNDCQRQLFWFSRTCERHK